MKLNADGNFVDLFAMETGDTLIVEAHPFTLKCTTDNLWYLESKSYQLLDLSGKKYMIRAELSRVVNEECYVITGLKA